MRKFLYAPLVFLVAFAQLLSAQRRIDDLALTQSLTVTDNPQLIELGDGVIATSNVIVRDNAELPQCLATALAESTLSATRRPSDSCSASKTTPIPPRPTSRRSR